MLKRKNFDEVLKKLIAFKQNILELDHFCKKKRGSKSIK